ncbi:MAG: tRNA pseudouridine(55) synthase TruB [Candidatus Omnitrophota bacterium]|jgi:tRNA pseudouridine55 synthase|nr:tRNA pseudouridine(55) synthase TruB [Candidatus Omnitrophota bacterium]
MKGIVLINKPQGLTSHDVVQRVRRQFNMRRVGHAGTLDPLATGLLVLLLGETTKCFNDFVNMGKAYKATFLLGVTTNSADIQGEVTQRRPYDHITRKQVEEVLSRFQGEIEQIPPMVSALKVKGKKLYTLARQGLTVERSPRKIHIRCFQLQEFNPPEVKFYVECSKGTYVRQLADDIGEILGCGACVTQIERTQIGAFTLQEAVRLEDLNESHIRHWEG